MKMPKKRGERELEGLEDEEWREKLEEKKLINNNIQLINYNNNNK